MTTLDKLSFLMKQSDLNKRQLSIKSKLAYSTVDNLWKRGSDSMRLPTFMKLCDFFNVTMDSMAYDDKEIESRIDQKDDFNQQLISSYHQHPEEQASVRKLLDLDPPEENEQLKIS